MVVTSEEATSDSVAEGAAELSTEIESVGQSSVSNEQILDPEEVLELEILDAANLTTSEEDGVLVQMIRSNPLAIGFIRYSSYLQNQDSLRALKIVSGSGIPIEANEDTVASGAYPFSRPLLIYTSSAAIQAKPALEGYMGCYLNRIFDEIEDVGYTAPSLPMYRDALENFQASCQRCLMSGSTNPLFPEVPACSPADVAMDPLTLTGGTTVYPLSARMIDLYRQAGFTGEMQIEDIGTGNGFERFCETGDADLVNASRLVKDDEEALCTANGRELIAFPVGLDLVVVVVSKDNSFIEQASFWQLETLFTDALRWSEVDPTWPAEFITRAIPNKSRGTFSFFVEMLYAGASSEPTVVLQAPTVPSTVVIATATPNVVAPTPAASLTSPPLPDTPNTFIDYQLGYVEGDVPCTFATEVLQTVLQQEFDYSVELIPFASKDQLFEEFTNVNYLNRIDWTFCSVTPDDSAYLEQESSTLSIIGSPYYVVGAQQYQTVIYSALKWVLRREQPCIYSLLSNFSLDTDDLNGVTVTDWLNEHQELVQNWASCR